MEIQFSGTLSLQDFERAQALDGRTRLISFMMLGLAGILLLIQVLSLLSAPFSLAAFMPLLPLVVGGLVFWVFVRWQVRRAWKNNQAVYADVSGVITEDTVAYNTSQSESRSRWTLFQKSKLAPDMILLYQTSGAFNVFSRHFFETEADWTMFAELVQRKIAQSRGRGMTQPQ